MCAPSIASAKFTCLFSRAAHSAVVVGEPRSIVDGTKVKGARKERTKHRQRRPRNGTNGQSGNSPLETAEVGNTIELRTNLDLDLDLDLTMFVGF